MEKLKLSIEEFFNTFKPIAAFSYEFRVIKGFVLIIASAEMLRSIGF